MKSRHVITVLCALGVAGCGSSHTAATTSGTTPTTATPAATTKPANEAPQTYEGNGSENIGIIKVGTESTLEWTGTVESLFDLNGFTSGHRRTFGVSSRPVAVGK